jgi:fructoselysine 6-kinase
MLPDATAFRSRLSARGGPVISQDCSVSSGLDDLAVAFASAGESDEVAELLLSGALEAGAEVAIATLGARGAALRTRDGVERRAPGHPTEVVDTTGAGDSLMAGYIAAAVEGASPVEALEAGIRRGAYTCRYVGGWPQLPGDPERFG